MKGQFEKLNHIKALNYDIEELSNFHEKYKNTCEQAGIDKYKKGFNADSRFKSFSADVYFSAYTGVYGSSSVGTALSLHDPKEVGKALVEYIKNNEEEVFAGIIKVLEEKSKSLLDSARFELDEAYSYLNDINKELVK